VLTHTMPLAFADAICGSEAAGAAAALLVVFAGAVFAAGAGAIEFAGAAIELAGVAAGAGADAG